MSSGIKPRVGRIGNPSYNRSVAERRQFPAGRIANPSYDRSVAERWQFPIGRIATPSHVIAAP
jgi:hypothetical protein